MSKNIFCLYGKLYFTNVSALTVKYGTRRAKPAGTCAVRIGLFLSARYVTLLRSLRLLHAHLPAKFTIILNTRIEHIFSCVLYDLLLSHV